MSATRVAILGAGGVVGSHLLAHLSRDPQLAVWGVCRNPLVAAPLRLRGLQVRCGSATGAEAEEILGDAEVIIHCAAAGGLPARARAQNRALIDALARFSGLRRLLYFSSVAVYGTCIDPRRNTFAYPRPDWLYGRDKLLLEHYLLRRLRSRFPVAVLRMGHVYGIETWVSRAVLQGLSDSCPLPWDGRRPSNAIHLRNIVAAVRQAIEQWPETEICNLQDHPASTWREVFDWHAQAVGAASAPALDGDESERLGTRYRQLAASSLLRRSLAEARGWLGSLPGSLVRSAPSTKQLALGWMAGLGMENMERRALMSVSSLGAAAPAGGVEVPFWLFSQGAPGPSLAYAAARGPQDARALAAWHRRYSRPQSILDWESLEDEVTIATAP